MTHHYHRFKKYLKVNISWLLLILTIDIAIGATLFFLLNGNQNLGNYDAVARLNIARKMIDSLTPGIGQLGGIWLPFPQVLMTPLVSIDYMWHTGLAGAIVSGIAFVIAAYFLYKIAFMLTKSVKASLIVWLLFVGNVNILFLQSMALAEMFFLMCLVMILYFLMRWYETHSVNQLLLTGAMCVLISLTRYEGYFILVGTTLAVMIEAWRAFKKESWHKVEGTVLLFLTIAGFGVLLWCIYGFLFYGDFLHWLHLYSDGKLQVSTAEQSVRDTNEAAIAVTENSIGLSFSTYTQMIMAMSGNIITAVGVAGLAMTSATLIWYRKHFSRYTKYVPIILISVITYAFLIYGYQKGFIPEVSLPPQPIPLEDQKSFTAYSDNNARYGIILYPLIVLFAGLLAARHKFLMYTVIILFGIQLYANVVKPQEFQQSLPHYSPYRTLNDVPWFQDNYDHGLILISANAHEDFMFQTGLPYKTFIYEGTRDYWIDSLNDPSKHARWIIFDTAIQGDTVTYFLSEKGRTILQNEYEEVHENRGFYVYRKKGN